MFIECKHTLNKERYKMTPFAEAGYNENTKFKVLEGFGQLVTGDVVKIARDDGSIAPRFETEDGRRSCMFLPVVKYGVARLEVYTDK